MTRPLVPLVVLALILCPSVAPARAGEADTVLLNGTILLFHGVERHDGAEKPKFAQALAIAGGRILFAGPDKKAKKYVGPKTRVIDLKGRMVMPGIVDGHFHGTRRTDCEMGYAGGTVAEVLARLQACLDRPEQAALKGSNVQFAASHLFGEAILPPGTPLTRYDLDRLDTTRPVLVRNADGHKFWMNSRAIANARIDENTPTPADGEIGRDASRKPNGFFADVDFDDWGEAAPLTEEMRLETVRQTNRDANRMGITSVFIPGDGEDQIARWAKVQDEGTMTLRANLGLSAPFVRGNSDRADLRRQIAALGEYKKYAKGLIEVSSVKVYCDGVMEYPAHTGAMLQPYRINAGTLDKPVWKPGTNRGPDPSCADARPGYVELDKAGWQIHVHAIGDRATRDALDNFEAARKENGDRDLRHTITHLEAIDAADVPRFAALGVVASMSLQWARRDAYLVEGTVGFIDDALYERLFPAGELWRAHAVIAGGSDYPVDPLLPFVQIETAIDHTGESVAGVHPGALSPREVIPDLLAVLKMHTINAAYEMHQDATTGSIEVGKYADLIVLSQDLFRVATEQISDTKVLMTMLEGKVVYQNAAGGLTDPPEAARDKGAE
ncbi:MAG TPA: amidohydrolase [Candidatus Polarisedimenticolia bacterium]|nr:amidohydrolase [Candidatus Polarisedimenticolia bacterium]